MSDHWKSLANMLGAPGVDMPESEVAESADLPAPTTSSREDVPSQTEKAHSHRPATEKDGRSDAPTFRSTGRGAADDRSTSKARQSPSAQTSGVEETAVRTSPRPERSGQLSPPKQESEKRKSSWDKLTKLFGMGGTDEELPEPIAESTAASSDFADQSHVGHETIPATPTDALEALFSDAPRKTEADWRSESSLRVVDDVSWDDDPPVKRNEMGDEQGEPSEASGEETPNESRRRPRRRRGSKDRNPERSHAKPIRRPDDAVAGSMGWEEDVEVEEPVESADSWSEPETFVTDDNSEEPEIVDRRSSRRHRRGNSERMPEPIGDSADRDETRSRDEAPRREGASPREESSRREGASRREGSQKRSREERRPSRENREHPRRATMRDSVESHPIDVEEEADLQDLDLSIDGEEPGNKHRKIPSWADSLESIIANNMDNHRRSEGGRDGGPRGRPRGRR